MAKKKSKQRSGKPAAPKQAKTATPDEPDTAAESTPNDEATSTDTDTTAKGDVAEPKSDKSTSGSGAKKADKSRSGPKGRSGKNDSVFGQGSQKSRPGGKTRPGGKSGGKGKKKGRKTSAPKQPLPWGMITLVSGLVILVAGLIAVPFLFLPDIDPDEPIDGVIDYYVDEAPWVEESAHLEGKLDYELSPPAGGNHNSVWTTCNGKIYQTPVPNEHAVHSLEHGAIWFTYNPDAVTADQIKKLEAKVNGIDYTFMSPYPGQTSPIMLTTWGYQLELTSADDERISAFTGKYRLTSSREPGASCSGGTSITGDTPITAEGMER